MRTPSLKRRVTYAGVTVVVVLLLAFDAFVYLSLRAGLEQGLQEVLDTRADIARSLGRNLAPVELVAELTKAGVPVQIETPEGEVLRGEPLSPRFGQGGIPSALPLPQVQQELSLPNGARVTVFATRAGVDAALRRLLLLEMLGTAVGFLVAAVGLAWAARVALRPLDLIVQTVGRITEGGTAERLRPEDAKSELGRMATAFDAMLDSLEAAISEARASEETTRRFLADAAHQLRTPAAGLRLAVEAFLRENDPDVRDQLLGHLVRETGRLGRLISSLLRIARLDQRHPPERSSVRLADLVREEADRAHDLAPHLEVQLVVRNDPGAVLLNGDEIREALANVLENARRHAQGCIKVTVEGGDDAVDIAIRDDGPGVPSEEREKIFTRFVAIDGMGGSGLGLPIARAVAIAHGGDLSYVDGAFVFRLPLPASSREKQEQETMRP